MSVGALSFELSFGCHPGHLWAITERATLPGVNHCALSCLILQSLPCNGAGSHSLDKRINGIQAGNVSIQSWRIIPLYHSSQKSLKPLVKIKLGRWEMILLCLFVLLIVYYGQCFCLFVCHFIVCYFPALSTSTKSFFSFPESIESNMSNR